MRPRRSHPSCPVAAGGGGSSGAADVCCVTITRLQVDAASHTHAAAASDPAAQAAPCCSRPARRASEGGVGRLLPLLLLALLLCATVVQPTCALQLLRASLRTHVLALEGSGGGGAATTLRSISTSIGGAETGATTAGAAAGASPAVSNAPLLVAARLAVLSLRFDDNMLLRAVNASSGAPLDDDEAVPLTDLRSLTQLYGSARLICGSNLFDSHPPHDSHEQTVAADGSFAPDRSNATTTADVDALPALLPSFMLLTPMGAPGQWAEHFPLLALLDAEADHRDAAEEADDVRLARGRSMRAFLVLSAAYAPSDLGGAPVWRHFVDAANLRPGRCSVRLPPPSSQSWRAGAGVVLHGRDGRPADERPVPVMLRRAPRHRGDLPLPALRSTPLPAAVVRNLLRSARRSESKRSIGGAGASSFIQTSAGSSAMAAAGAQTEVRFAGMLKGLMAEVLNGLAAPMGNMIGDFTAEGVLDPVADKVLDGVRDAVQAGLSQYATGDIVVQLVPGVCETVTAALVESTAVAIANEVVRGATETITTDVTDRVTASIVDPATLRSSQTISVKLARSLHNSLAHILSRSIPHVVVPSLLSTVSVGLKEDYYCYFCAEKQVYCQYCHKNRGDTATRLYYALYYTAYHSTYYSQWYATPRKFGVLMVQKRQMHPLDEVDDEHEKAWDVRAREEEEGTQTEPEEPAEVVLPEGEEGGGAEGGGEEGGGEEGGGEEGGGEEGGGEEGGAEEGGGAEEAGGAEEGGGEEAGGEEEE